jgi:Lipase (class 2)
MSDIQVAGEYVVYALREMSRFEGRDAARKVQVIGFSQGGMVPRWALRFWPDTRKLVDDDVGLDASNHGTLTAEAACLGGCAPAIWQQRTNSAFVAALNSYQETFPGISYTEIYSQNDEIVVPNLNEQGSSSVHTGGGTIANIAVQEICPGHVADHLAMGSYDPVGYALALDAVTHPGPAQAVRIDRAVCTEAFQPGVNPATFATDFANYATTIATVDATYPHVASEPPLNCYVMASCPHK